MSILTSGRAGGGYSRAQAPKKGSIASLAAKLLPIVARTSATQHTYSRAGSSFFYELSSSWETKVLEQDNEVLKVYTGREMEQAFKDPKTKTLLIPKDSAITKTLALKICTRNGLSKTIFYEATDNE